MADSIKNQILDNVITTLEGITTENGYNRDVRAVSRSAKTLGEAQRDMVFVATSSETKESFTNGITQMGMTVMLACVVEDRDDIGKAVDDIAADVEKALLVDTTRGAKALDTNIVRIEDQIIEELEPMGSCLVEVEIRYRHAWGDPYTAIGG